MNARRGVTFAVLLASCRPCGAETPAPASRPVETPVPREVTRRELAIDDLARRTWGAGKDATFQPTTLVEREAVVRLVPALLAAAATEPPPDPSRFLGDAARAGMTLEVWTVGDTTLWALVEAPAARRGAGAYLFRAGVAPADLRPAILLEAPHADHDLGSGDIAAALFVAPPGPKRPRALFVNSIHRYQLEPGRRQRGDDNPADVAHNPDHLFSAATDAAAAALGDVVVIQIHGFAEGAEGGDDGADAGVDAPRLPPGTLLVISAGDRRGSSPTTTALAAELNKAFGPGVRRFPEEAGALGATTNVQGRLLAAHPGARFVHLELAAELRKQLRASPAKLRTFGLILSAAR
jgi:hypothetical protein